MAATAPDEPADSDPGRRLAESLFRRAVAACQPETLVKSALHDLEWPANAEPGSPVWIFSAGKAADGMAAAAVDELKSRRLVLAGGLVVAADDTRARRLLPSVRHVKGDHPLPGNDSQAAAIALEHFAAGVARTDRVLALISGGTSSLIGAPVEGIRFEHYWSLCAALLDSGLDITELNVVRKRFSRWGAGRLALALWPSPIATIAISDVPFDDPEVIGSGPTVGDHATVRNVRDLLERVPLPADVRRPLDRWLTEVETGARSDTPKPGASDLAHASRPTVITAEVLLHAAIDAARAAGAGRVVGRADRVSGEAARSGAMLAADLIGFARSLGRGQIGVIVAYGEPVVLLPPGAPPGGRCQEMALMAARILHDQGHDGVRCTLLAAGSDGRDGATEAAGAVVNATTWRKITEAGIDPDRALTSHGSNAALRAVGALIPRFPSGTNLGDVMIGIVQT